MVRLVNGTLVQSYMICKRQAWLMSRQIIPDQQNPYIELGRLIDEESYGRDKKKINLENIVIDLIRNKDEEILIGEVKKSSRAKESAKMQLLFYLYILKEKGLNTKGILLFPEEKKKELVELTEEMEIKIKNIIEEIEYIILQELPPPFKKNNFCSKCGYKEFCLS